MEPISNESESKATEDFPILLKVPRYLVELLDAEAKREQRNRTRQAIRILEERYGVVETVEEAQRLSA